MKKLAYEVVTFAGVALALLLTPPAFILLFVYMSASLAWDISGDALHRLKSCA